MRERSRNFSAAIFTISIGNGFKVDLKTTPLAIYLASPAACAFADIKMVMTGGWLCGRLGQRVLRLNQKKANERKS